MKHLAIIADGNRRWAKKNNFSEQAGYWQALKTIERCCLWCLDNKVEFLTAYCLSTENWRRGDTAISMLFELADVYLTEQIDWYIDNNIRIRFSGRRDRLKSGFAEKMKKVEEQTS
jgi:undecaprenyl diphosphate synthase